MNIVEVGVEVDVIGLKSLQSVSLSVSESGIVIMNYESSICSLRHPAVFV